MHDYGLILIYTKGARNSSSRGPDCRHCIRSSFQETKSSKQISISDGLEVQPTCQYIYKLLKLCYIIRTLIFGGSFCLLHESHITRELRLQKVVFSAINNQYQFINLYQKGSSIVHCPAKRKMQSSFVRTFYDVHHAKSQMAYHGDHREQKSFHLICLDMNYYVMCPSFLSSYFANGRFAHSLPSAFLHHCLDQLFLYHK